MPRSPRLNTAPARRRDPRPALTPHERATLQLAVQLRYLTVPLLVCFLDCSPDSAYRRLRRLTRLGLLRSERWQPGFATGPPSIVAALTAKGAHAFAGTDPVPKNVTILVRRSAARLRKVAAGEITTLAHDLATLLLVGLVRRAFPPDRDPRAGAPLLGERFRLRRTVPLDRIPVNVLGRLGLLVPGQDAELSYLPDAILPWTNGDKAGALFLEVETGAGGRLPADIGVQKATQFAALWARLQTAPALDRLGPLDLDAVHFVLWCPTEHFRRKALDGVARVTAEDLPLLTLTADDVPLAPPPGLPKGMLQGWMAESAVRLRSVDQLATMNAAPPSIVVSPRLSTGATAASEEPATDAQLGSFSLISPR